MFFDELSNDEWAQLAVLVSDEPAIRLNRRGRPRAEPRIVANAVLWILTTGEPWSKLPGRYPSGPTCRRRFEEWQINGTLTEMVRLLSQVGRSFAYVPEPGVPVATPKPVVDTQPHTPALRDDGLRGVFWRSPESWQNSPRAAHPAHEWRSLDPIADITRQLSGTASEETTDEELLQDRAHVGAERPLDCEHRPVWMNMTSRGKQIVDRHGYVIYVAVEQVPNAMFRAWAEIMKDGKRVERSGLIGPRFAQADAAQEFALGWAADWIDRHCRTLDAVADIDEAVRAAEREAQHDAVPAARIEARHDADGVRHESVVAAPLQSAPRTLPAVRTVPEPVANSYSANAHVAAYTHACRVALRRYPTSTPAGEQVDNAGDRFPKAPELVSHAG
ncbi:transposase [Paraburkholderia acidicola]|uniref:Transposase n=1 Tax=Paraburkholderia acidicola TaxID=1912599 RepID=A0A2A4F5K9_9BURK|nr:transposase [Paraburkholderia acidicola]